jgi:hypothetical protein
VTGRTNCTALNDLSTSATPIKIGTNTDALVVLFNKLVSSADRNTRNNSTNNNGDPLMTGAPGREGRSIVFLPPWPELSQIE